ncbi:MAG: hypothetical protein IPN76_29660 [Saprospiraceae bacterium]|nr:hypothetical protein [Saprospiraceae bacterium]
MLAYGQLPTVNPVGAGISHATVAMSGPASLFANPAGLNGTTGLTVSAGAEQRFLLSELQSVAVAVGLPTRSGNFAFSAQSFGYEGFRQQKIGLSYARKFWESLSVGVRFNYFQTRIPDYGNRGLLSFEVGMQANISKSLTIGAQAVNPAQVELVEGENLPSVLLLGLRWQVSSKLFLCSEVEKDLDQKLRMKNGLEYQPIEPLRLRVGYATEPSMLFFGVGYAFGTGFQADTAGSFHQTLGFSPSAGLQWVKK